MRVLPEDVWDDEIRQGVDWARQHGVENVTVLTGLMEVEVPGAEGTYSGRILGQYDPDTRHLYIRADSRSQSFSETIEHEVAHLLAGEKQVKSFMNAVTSDNSYALWGTIYHAYENAYQGLTNDYGGMTAMEKAMYLWEEILGDAWSDVNKFGVNASLFGSYADAALADAYTPTGRGSTGDALLDLAWDRGTPRFSVDPESSSIKEQIAENQERLNSMDIVASVSVPTDLTSKMAAAQWAAAILKSTGYKVDRQGGEIYFTRKDLDSGLRYADTAEERAALAVLPRVLKRGIEIGVHREHKGRTKQTITFAAPVELNGTRGNVAVVVNRHGNHYYAHRIVLPDGRAFRFSDIKIDTAQELPQGVTDSGSLADATSAVPKTSIAQTQTKVNPQNQKPIDLIEPLKKGQRYSAEEAAREQEATARAQAAANRLAVQQAQTKLATDTARQIEDLRAQGEFDKADAALQISQKYLTQLVDIQQWVASYNLSADQFEASLQKWQAEYDAAMYKFRAENGLAYDRLAQEQGQKQLASLGQAMLAAGLMPTSGQLAAMGMTQAQASAALMTAQLERASGGMNEAAFRQMAQGMAASLEQGASDAVVSGIKRSLDKYWGKMNKSQKNQIQTMLNRYGVSYPG